jgi:hypothetical protein
MSRDLSLWVLGMSSTSVQLVEELEIPVCPEAEAEIIRGGSVASELTIEVVVDVTELSEGYVDGREVVSTGGIMVL